MRFSVHTGILAEHLRHRPRHDVLNYLHPFHLEGVAHDRRVPVGGNLEFGKWTFTAKVLVDVSTFQMSEATPPVSFV